MSDLPKETIRAAELLVESIPAGVQMVIVIRSDDGTRIQILDNSGVAGLTGSTLLDAAQDVLDQIFKVRGTDWRRR